MNKYLIGLVAGGIVWWGFTHSEERSLNVPTKVNINVKYNRLGLLSDIHGDKKNVSYFLEQFQERKVDAVFASGDIADRSQWIFTNRGEQIIQLFGQSGLPVYILPGNHDQRYFYENAMVRQIKKYPNLHDLLKERRIDTEGIDFISNPYGEGKSYLFSGYYATEKEYQELEIILTQPTQAPIILITHQPPLCKGEYGIDYTLEKQNNGNKRLDEIMRKYNITFSFSGHIHSVSGGCGENGRYIPECVYSPILRLNPGAVIKHRTKNREKSSAAIVTIQGKEMMYELLER